MASVKIIAPHRLSGLHGHRVVVLDIFRASNTILALLRAGAERVYLLSAADSARALKQQKPEALLWGERKGRTIEGMEGGNSPARAGELDLKGREAILTTSAGTQAVERLCRLEGLIGIYFGSFANASFLVEFLSRENKPVALLPMGLEAREPALEDDLAARFLQEYILQKKPPCFASLKPMLLNCPGARRLLSLGQEEDLAICSELDSMRIIPTVKCLNGLPPFAAAIRCPSPPQRRK